MKLSNSSGRKNKRRYKALLRLQTDFNNTTKWLNKPDVIISDEIKAKTESRLLRMEEEIGTLKQRIPKTPELARSTRTKKAAQGRKTPGKRNLK